MSAELFIWRPLLSHTNRIPIRNLYVHALVSCFLVARCKDEFSIIRRFKPVIIAERCDHPHNLYGAYVLYVLRLHNVMPYRTVLGYRGIEGYRLYELLQFTDRLPWNLAIFP